MRTPAGPLVPYRRMPLALQARLLRILEDHEVTSLGSESALKVNGIPLRQISI